jgi:hypothetical protein
MKLSDKPLKIEGEACGKRIIDSLYKSGDNYYFLDTGWPDSSSHPDHCIGKLIKAENEKWTFQLDDDTFVISPINRDDLEYGGSMLKRYRGWKEFLMKNYPKEDGALFIKCDLQLKEDIKEIIDYVDIQ